MLMIYCSNVAVVICCVPLLDRTFRALQPEEEAFWFYAGIIAKGPSDIRAKTRRFRGYEDRLKRKPA